MTHGVCCGSLQKSCARVRLLVFFVLFGNVLLLNAQEPTPGIQSETRQVSADQSLDSPSASVPEQEKNEKKQSHRGSFIAAPIPISSPAIGSGATLVAAYIFPLKQSDKISPPSVVGVGAMFTNGGTRAFAVGTQLFFRQNRYQVVSAIARGDLNYDFYGTGNQAGDSGIKLALKQSGTIFFAEVMRNIGWHTFVGPRIFMGSSSLSTEKSGDTHPELPPLSVGFNLRAIGIRIQRDTVPNRFYPESGTSLKFSADFFSKGLGSTFSFQTYRLTFSKYHSITPKQVFAYNAFICSTAGDPPFFGKCIFGTQNELRGYTAGRYIDWKMLATQAEYRITLPKRFGVVAFAGLGEVGPEFGKFNNDNLLGSFGGGVRFNLSKQYHLNLRADIAQGKNGHTFSMGIGEAF